MENKFIWTIVAIGLILRLLTLNNAISFDEYTQTRAVVDANNAGLDKYTEMNPLTTWTRLFVTSMLGIEIWSLRLTSLIFASLTILLLYFTAKELYDKKTALWAVALLSLSAWHALVSTSISFDGAFMTFYTLLTMYCFVKHEKTGKNSWLYLCGVAFGLTVLTKYTGVLIFPALLLYSLINHKDVKRSLKQFFTIGLFGLFTFSIFPLIAFLFSDPSYFWITLQHGENYFGGRSISFVLLAIQYALALLWAGPLLLFGYVLSWTNLKKQDWINHSLIFVVLLFYTLVVQDPFRPVERYFTLLLPSLCMLIGSYFASLKIDRGSWRFFGAAFIVLLALNLIFNALPGDVLPFYPKTNFIDSLLSLDWNFFVPFTGDQGPVGLYVKFLIFAIAFIASVICFIMLLRKKETWKAMLLLAIGLALSIFMMSELSLHITSPDISKVVKETGNFVVENKLNGPYYVFRDYAMQHYIGSNATQIDFDWESRTDELGSLLNKGGTLVVVDFPALDKQSQLWKVFYRCTEVKNIEDRGLVLGHVFACDENIK